VVTPSPDTPAAVVTTPQSKLAPGDTLRKSFQDAMRGLKSTFGSFRQQVHHHPVIIRRPAARTTGTATPELVIGVTDAPAGTGQTNDMDATEPGSTVTATDATEPGSTATDTEPTTTGGVAVVPLSGNDLPGNNSASVPASLPLPAPPTVTPQIRPATPAATDLPATTVPTADRVRPPIRAVAAIGDVIDAAGAVQVAVLMMPQSDTPITDVITSMETLLTAAADSVVSITQLPGDLATYWGVPTSTVSSTVNITRPNAAPAPVTLAGGPRRLGRSPFDPLAVVAPAVADYPRVTSLATPEPLAAPVIVTPPAAPPAPAAEPVAAPQNRSAVPAFIKGAVAAVVLSVSLWALFTAALPGLSGLAALSATGMRIGYRQAKAGSALHATELGRFVASGPIGIVRSDSLIALRPRSSRAGASRRQVLDTAA